MGYRSDLALVVYPEWSGEDGKPESECKAEYQDKYAMLKLLMNTQFKEVIEHWDPKFDDRAQRMLIHEEGVKYYDTYPETIVLERFRSDIVELGYCMEFIRIGEESDDIEETYEGNNIEYVLRVSRSIEIN
jgi:hypothetical protein